MRLSTRFRSRRNGRRSRGQSLVEFAVILPVMLLFLAAVLDLGRIFYANITLHNAAREGAFAAAVDPDSFDAGQPCNTATNMVTCRVQLESKDSAVEIDAADITMSCSDTGCPDQSGSTVTVGVTGEFTLITPLLSIVFGGQTIDLASEATAQIEYLPAPNTATLPPPPVAQATETSSSGLTVTFDASGSSGDPTDWQWNFGDGNSDTGGPTITHTYDTDGVYDVTVTVINLAGSDDYTFTVTVGTPATPTATSTGTGGPTPTPSPTAFNCYPPNVIGLAPATAQADLINAGFSVLMYNTLTNGPKNKIQSMNPDFTECLAAGTPIEIWYRPS
jgi:PKD repeat protein